MIARARGTARVGAHMALCALVFVGEVLYGLGEELLEQLERFDKWTSRRRKRAR